MKEEKGPQCSCWPLHKIRHKTLVRVTAAMMGIPRSILCLRQRLWRGFKEASMKRRNLYVLFQSATSKLFRQTRTCSFIVLRRIHRRIILVSSLYAEGKNCCQDRDNISTVIFVNQYQALSFNIIKICSTIFLTKILNYLWILQMYSYTSYMYLLLLSFIK